METCTTCHNSHNADHLYFCYVCSKRICSDCVQFITLPLDTQASICSDCLETQEQSEANESMMEIMVNATLNGHDLSQWEKVVDNDGWQAVCRNCNQSVWVGSQGLIYSLLDDYCSER